MYETFCLVPSTSADVEPPGSITQYLLPGTQPAHLLTPNQFCNTKDFASSKDLQANVVVVVLDGGRVVVVVVVVVVSALSSEPTATVVVVGVNTVTAYQSV